MKTIIYIAISLAAIGSSGHGQGIVFEHDEDVLIVRGRDLGGNAIFELLADGGDRLQCVAMGQDGKLLAVQTTYADSGSVIFRELDVAVVDSVSCRKN